MPQLTENHDKLILGGILLVGGYFFVLKPILEKVGLQKSAEELATEAKNKSLVDSFVFNTQKVQQPTKSIEEWKIIADQIYADLRASFLSNNYSDAVYQICRVQNDADVALLIKYFAKRRQYILGIPNGPLANLSGFVHAHLSDKALATIAWNYANKKIKFRF